MPIVRLESKDLVEFKMKMQEAFQYGYESVFGVSNSLVLQENDIDASLKAQNSKSYVYVDREGIMLGGAIVSIDGIKNNGYLNFLFVDSKMQIVE